MPFPARGSLAESEASQRLVVAAVNAAYTIGKVGRQRPMLLAEPVRHFEVLA